MARNLCFFLFVSVFAFSYREDTKEEFFSSLPEQVATTPELIADIISPLSGLPVLQQTDLTVRGAQNLTLSRVYTSPFVPCAFTQGKGQEWEKHLLTQHIMDYYKGWQSFPHVELLFTPDKRKVLYTNRGGNTLSFHFNGPGLTNAKLERPLAGLSNTAGTTPSGQYDPRNIRIKYCAETGHIIAHDTDRTTRIYSPFRIRPDQSQAFLLEKEILPSGKVLRYHYKNGCPSSIESMDPKEQHTYASIQIQGHPWMQRTHFLSSTEQLVRHQHERRSITTTLFTKEKRWYGNKTQESTREFLCPPTLQNVISPNYENETSQHNNQFLLTNFDSHNHHFKIEYAESGNTTKIWRAHKVLLPVGENDTPLPVYTLEYNPPLAGRKNGSTIVTTNDGITTKYHFSKKLLTASIQQWTADETRKKKTLFTWDHNCRLQELGLYENGALFSKIAYTYDRFGNPITETQTADLTGSGFSSKTTHRTFSKDRKNLLLREETSDGKTTTFSYLAGTDLLTKKVTKTNNFLLKETWTYDHCHNLVKSTYNDGLEKRVTRYRLRQAPPFLHMPEWIEETYLEDGVEHLLKKTHLNYDTHGNLATQEIYNAANSLSYTIHKTYNERGDLLSETNPLGQKAHHTYDDKGRLLTSRNFSGRLTKTFSYDTRGRQRSLQEQGDDGTSHTTTYTYDAYDRCTHTTDHFDNTTQYDYDPLTNQVIHTTRPDQTTTHATYDTLGRKTSTTDANGNTTIYQYNAYGSPTLIIHPNGSKETFRYTKTGHLRTHTDPEGNTIRYKRDALGRVLQKTFLSPKGETITCETYTYRGNQLRSHTDADGNTKHYRYDGAGRKIHEAFCGKTIDYTYDSLGYIATICHNNMLIIRYTRDLEGRILEELKTDIDGNPLHKVQYTYDTDGNQSALTRFIHNKPATTHTTYDPFGRQISRTDPQGHTTYTTYNENATNTAGQRVLQIITTDPENVTTAITHDTLGRTTQITKNTTPPIHQIKTYDSHGNLTSHTENAQATHYTYTPTHHIATCTRSHQRTAYTYTPSGKLHIKTLPDDTTLTYTYNTLGHLTALLSSDGTIHHTFTHNNLGRILTTTDHINNLTITRTLDPHGNILQETFPYATITKTYDLFDRPLTLTTPHGTTHYTYDALYPRTVTHNTLQHTYTAYDLAGNLLQEELPLKLGTVNHTTDTRQQKARIATPYFTQTCTYSPAQNLLTSNNTTYQYDTTYQLTQESDTTYRNDALYNRTHKNDAPYQYNDRNELLSDGTNTYTYDLRGNRITKNGTHYTYDALNQLTHTENLHNIYDPLGRRLYKNGTYYLYDGPHEIGTADTFRMLQNHRTLAILLDRPYITLLDTQNNIRRLVNPDQTIAYDYTAFGEPLHQNTLSPWQYASKRLDPETGLIYFGKRFYDPTLGRWLTTDPAGTLDSYNLYQYALNNPLRYYDPNGESLGGYLLGLGEIALGGALILSGGVLQVATFGGYTIGLGFQINTGVSLIGLGLATTKLNEKDLSLPWKTGYSRSPSEYHGYSTVTRPRHDYSFPTRIEKDNENTPSENAQNKPPYSGKELGNNPEKRPDEEFEWRGKGKPGSKQGSWYNENTGESLHPDLDHPPPKQPHWDYKGPNFPNGVRLNIDGTWEIK